jgi:flavin reductase (DIM6/NTAB) family NADH-FMN oxidoreductase RutF
MNKSIVSAFFGSGNPIEYVSLAIRPDQLQDRAYLGWVGSDRLFDVTAWHIPLSLEPVIFGIALDENAMAAGAHTASAFSLSFAHRGFVHEQANPEATRWLGRPISKFFTAALLLERYTELSADSQRFLLLRATKSRLNQCQAWRRWIISRYFYHRRSKNTKYKSALPFSLYHQFCAIFSFPRRVALISVSNRDYFNLFPMDFHGLANSSGEYALGLRHSNRAVEMMRQSGKVVVCDVPASSRDDLYELGRYHSASPASCEELPFKMTTGQKFGFAIPVNATGYREIELEHTFSLGSHFLLLGRTVHVKHSVATPQLYHIHFLQQLFADRFGLSYERI